MEKKFECPLCGHEFSSYQPEDAKLPGICPLCNAEIPLEDAKDTGPKKESEETK